jgi:hypothetical protein
MKHWLPNALGFQMVWCATVAGAARGWWWAGPLAVSIFAIWQLSVSRAPRDDLVLMLVAAVIGFAVDSAWVLLGFMRFSTPAPWSELAPIWIVSLWVGFALTLNHSLAGLKQHLWLAMGLGLVGGPLAYAFAERTWRAVELGDPVWLVFGALALAWGAATPALLFAARGLDRRSVRTAAAR